MPVSRGTGINRNQQKFGPEAIQRRLMGLRQAGSMSGVLSRGKNIYNGVTYAAHSGGGPQFGRPRGSRDVGMRSAINRRIAQRNRLPMARRVR